MSNKINVIIRKRPPHYNEQDNIVVDAYTNEIHVHEMKTKVDLSKYNKIHKFPYDKVYGNNDSTKDIYDNNISTCIGNLLNGSKLTCYAYGQTGSGKTHTIFGNNTHPGLILLSAQELFSKNPDYVEISSYEIYNDETYDLLNNKKQVHVREGYHKILHVVGLTSKEITTYERFCYYLDYITSMRNTGISSQNDSSSRSHAVFEINIHNRGKIGKIMFVDLAGSERGSQSVCENRNEYRENSHINKSLLALKECIRSTIAKKPHIPFRSSKLTTILRDSFSTNCMTLVVGTISPGVENIVDGLNTLLYTSNIKYIKKVQYEEPPNLKQEELPLITPISTPAISRNPSRNAPRSAPRSSSRNAPRNANDRILPNIKAKAVFPLNTYNKYICENNKINEMESRLLDDIKKYRINSEDQKTKVLFYLEKRIKFAEIIKKKMDEII